MVTGCAGMVEVSRTGGELAVASAQDCGSAAWNGCRNGYAAHDRRLAHRDSLASAYATISYEPAGRGSGRCLSKNSQARLAVKFRVDLIDGWSQSESLS